MDRTRRPLPPPALPPQWQADAPPRAYLPPRHFPPPEAATTVPGVASPDTAAPAGRRVAGPRARTVVRAVAGTFVLAFLGSALGTGKLTPGPSAAAVSASPPTIPAWVRTACGKRPPASGDIDVRQVAPGAPPRASRLGGGWGWDYTRGQCLTAVQLVIANARLTAGYCTQVGYVADNLGYTARAVNAPPLTRVADQVGPACPALPR